MPILVFVVALLLGGGITSAEQSLPGDFLYPVKVTVNEPVVGIFSFTGADKARWDMRIAERRLEELERLISESRLSNELLTRLQENFIRYADKADERLKKIKDSNAWGVSDISLQFGSSLRAHHAILEKFTFEENGRKKLLDVIKEKYSKIEDRKGEADKNLRKEEGAINNSAAEGKIRAAKNKIEEVVKYIDAKKEKFGEEVASEALARLEEATKMLGNAEEMLRNKEYFSAFTLARDAHGLAQEAKLLIEIRGKLKPTVPDSEDINQNKDDNTQRSVTSSTKIERKDVQEVACTQEYAPVCGRDGKTYSNACMAKIASVEVNYKGACEKEQLVCTQEYAPVCGRDGKTYGNSCLAKVAKTEIAYDGPCGQRTNSL